MEEVLGLLLVKINGIFELDVTNARWEVARNVVQHATGGGLKAAKGLKFPSGSFDEVVPRKGATDWSKLEDFTLDIYDQETRTIVIASFAGINWDKVGGTGDLATATLKKSISWKGTVVDAI